MSDLARLHRGRFVLSWCLSLLFAGSGFSDSPRELARFVDQAIEAQLEESEPTKLLDESAFLRRLTLDLAGRIPTAAELNEFRDCESFTKREEWVDRLLESPDFPFHQRNELDTLLLRRLSHNDAWREYLLEATRENRSWDDLFREVLCPEENRPEDLRATAYLTQRVQDLDTLTNDTSILWFGVNVACAKCHDHPLVFDWTQSHYYGLASFFKRTFRSKKGAVGERFDGRLKYETTSGEQHDANFMFLTGMTIEEPKLELNAETLKEYQQKIRSAERDETVELPPPPEFRPRGELVELALADDDHRFLAKNIVNRVWARMFGRGLVEPLDQMHSENPPSHPEIMDRLCDDLVAHGWDLKRLIKTLALTDAYARRMPAPQIAAEYPPDLFAAAIPRPLSPHQLALSLRLATGDPDDRLGLAGSQDWPRERAELERQSESIARQLEIPDEGFQVSVAEALWFSNGTDFEREFLNVDRDGLVRHLANLPDDRQVIETAFRVAMSRDATEGEVRAMTDYLAERSDRRAEGIAQLIWALVSSPEFRFNH